MVKIALCQKEFKYIGNNMILRHKKTGQIYNVNGDLKEEIILHNTGVDKMNATGDYGYLLHWSTFEREATINFPDYKALRYTLTEDDFEVVEVQINKKDTDFLSRWLFALAKDLSNSIISSDTAIKELDRLVKSKKENEDK